MRLLLQPFPSLPTAPPAADEVRVWVVGLDPPPADPAELLGLLTPDERDRAGRYRSPVVRHQFVVGRGLLRRILGGCLGAPPHAVPITYNPAGKPVLAGDPGLHFNLTHTTGLALVALAGRPVGVDVERVSGHIDVDAVARRYFSARELDLLLSLEPRERRRCFFRLWTCKEACVKADGRGIGALQGVAIDLEAGRAPRTRGYGPAELEPAPGYVAALAVPGSAAPPVTVLRWIHNNACSDRVLGRVA